MRLELASSGVYIVAMAKHAGIVALGALGAIGCAAVDDVDATGGSLGKGDLGSGSLAPWQGHQRALVLLLDWSNVDSTVTREQVEATFFGEGEGATSVRSFFLENAGSFDLTGDVLDWRSTSQQWSASAGCNLRSIVNAAWSVFSADVDVSQYDADGDGLIDNLFVVHSGRIGSDRVGPECTFTNSRHANQTIVFQSQGLGSIGDAIPIGFYIHEGGHGYYGLPDLYNDHYHGQYGIGMWGMMGLGAWGTNNAIPRADMFRVPSHFEPYSKVRIGWVEPRVITATERSVVLRPVELTRDIVEVPITRGLSYYLEYRSRAGFSAGHRGEGLLIWKNYDLVQADGRDDLNHGTDLGYRPLPPIAENFGDATDPFPGADLVTGFSDPASRIAFENIRRVDDHVEVDIVITGEVQLPIVPLETFDGIERL